MQAPASSATSLHMFSLLAGQPIALNGQQLRAEGNAKNLHYQAHSEGVSENLVFKNATDPRSADPHAC